MLSRNFRRREKRKLSDVKAIFLKMKELA